MTYDGGIVSTAALILAAGGSSRLGQPKQLADWGGIPLLQQVINDVRHWPVESIWIVLGHEAEPVLAALDLEDEVVVVNPDWDQGMAISLRVGVDALSQDSQIERVIVAMGDQPRVPLDLVTTLLETRIAQGTMAVVPKYRYTWGNPVIIGRGLWPRIMSLDGDEGARKLLKTHPEWVHEVWFDSLPPRDIDTQSDLEELRPRS